MCDCADSSRISNVLSVMICMCFCMVCRRRRVLTQFIMDVSDGAQSEGAQGFADFPVRRRWAVARAVLDAWNKLFGQQLIRTRRNWIFECVHESLRRAVMKIFG